jgi:hypothetical protein
MINIGWLTPARDETGDEVSTENWEALTVLTVTFNNAGRLTGFHLQHGCGRHSHVVSENCHLSVSSVDICYSKFK